MAGNAHEPPEPGTDCGAQDVRPKVKDGWTRASRPLTGSVGSSSLQESLLPLSV